MVPLKDAITQWGNVGGLIAGLYTNDYELIGRSLEDVIVEPLRKRLIPGFDETKYAALQNGALGAGISGAGPSIFALCKGEKNAEKVAFAMTEAFMTTGIPSDIHISKINPIGVKKIKST
jgi:homoserine kinase